MLASRSLDADRGQYGESLAEAISPATDASSWDAEWNYEVGKPLVNHAVKAHDDAVDAFRKKLPKDTPMPNGLIFPVRKVPFTAARD